MNKVQIINSDKLISMIYHILNGDALAYSFPDAKIDGTIIVFREALIDGNLSGEDLPSFWQTRAGHHQITEAEYNNSVVSQLGQILNSPDNSEFNLWFEYDLFCQLNMWFVLSLINQLPKSKKVFAVYTSYLDRNSQHFWNGFGPANSKQLKACYDQRIELSDSDICFGEDLWNAYKSGENDRLAQLSNNPSSAFPFLEEVVTAQIGRLPDDGKNGRPEKVIKEIIANGANDFNDVFSEFWKRESIYGFGDTQLKKIYDKIVQGE